MTRDCFPGHASDKKVAIVDANGKISAKMAGQVTITATAAGKTAKCTVTVLYKDVTNSKDFWYAPTNYLTAKGVVKGYANQTEFRRVLFRSGISWSPLRGLKGVKPPMEFGDDSGLFSWPCRKKGPHLAMTGASRGFSPAAAPVSDFSRGTTGSSESLSCGARDVRSPCVW